ncbi:MAG: hypothetical protein COV72_07325 [Candidatus Omnitrophica bacterium CG11_big_fil_rev_8_21_14_0_20_42_13]|uniref:histidine kinase n=1 Tax=Candidatus Ghiorseimicrobium undicola TaxID=1974746 RepID=A0A2H0LYP8_9BACT|nr:MAG: hypothetical protein COV72_07325 [Candidatus Omnitrophica bacterium CG11_big_fil_rev_8_21_14_0_20_42_13]
MFTAKIKKRLAEIEQELRSCQEQSEQFKRENFLIRNIIKSMIEGVIILDKDSRIISLNPSLGGIFNISQGQAKGRFFLEAVPNNDIFEVITRVLKDGASVSKELSLHWPVEGVFFINASPISEGGIISGCLVVLHDITELKKLEKIRSDFVANVSHEIKTPLTSIKGSVETLLEGALEDKENARSFLKIIQRHTDRLDNLVNDLLSLSSLESGEKLLKIERVDLGEICSDAAAGFKSLLRKSSIELKNELGHLFVTADKETLSRAFANLIDNAVKFNKQGGFIRIYSEDAGDKIKIIVEDSGIGIPAKDVPRIFERFYRVDKARSRQIGGTGLGLSIVRHAVELHGGSAGVESTEGLGSKFFITLPK